ncbi:hypothetical protein [Steroidobacter gossypii]|nr:hypothetical protein [Steroidobacter gossypii]
MSARNATVEASPVTLVRHGACIAGVGRTGENFEQLLGATFRRLLGQRGGRKA